MNRIVSLLKIDFKLMLRDKILLYIVLAPALLSFVMLAVRGGAAAGTVTFAAASGIPKAVLKNLEQLADVEYYDAYDTLEDRVSRMDSVAGVYMRQGKPVLLFEGNEPESYTAQASAILSRAIGGDIPVFENKKVQSAGNIVEEIATATLLLFAVFIAGSVSGLNIVAERESRAIKALAVSPLRLSDYLAVRMAAALLLALINILLGAVIMGKASSVPSLAAATLSSLPVLGIVMLLLGVYSANQIAAFASLKIVVPLCLMVPITSVFVPESFKFLYWWIPMYWQYESIAGSLSGGFPALPFLLTLVTGFAWFFILSKPAALKFGLRQS